MKWPRTWKVGCAAKQHFLFLRTWWHSGSASWNRSGLHSSGWCLVNRIKLKQETVLNSTVRYQSKGNNGSIKLQLQWQTESGYKEPGASFYICLVTRNASRFQDSGPRKYQLFWKMTSFRASLNEAIPWATKKGCFSVTLFDFSLHFFETRRRYN